MVESTPIRVTVLLAHDPLSSLAYMYPMITHIQWMPFTVVKPAVQNTYKCCRSRKYIRWHIPMHAIFSYLSYLGHPSLLGLQTKTKRQSNSSTFCSFKSYNLETLMSSAASAFVHATLKRSQKVPRVKVGHLGSPRWIPMIQVSFNSSCVAL